MPQPKESGIRQVTHPPLNGKESGKICSLVWQCQCALLLAQFFNLLLGSLASGKTTSTAAYSSIVRLFGANAAACSFGWLSLIEVDRG